MSSQLGLLGKNALVLVLATEHVLQEVGSRSLSNCLLYALVTTMLA